MYIYICICTSTGILHINIYTKVVFYLKQVHHKKVDSHDLNP